MKRWAMLLPADLGNGTGLDDLLAGLDGAGIELLEEPKLEFDQKLSDGEELLDLELGSGGRGQGQRSRAYCTCARWAPCRY